MYLVIVDFKHIVFFYSSEKPVTEIPLHMIILGAVVGVIATGFMIGICVACHHRRHDKVKEEKEKASQRSRAESSLEMSQTTSLTTAPGSKKSNCLPPPYYSLPRTHVKTQGVVREYIHRNSLTNSQSPSEGEIPDQHSDPGNYKKYQYTTEEDSSPCPSLYGQNQGQGQGPQIMTTIVERHDIPPQTEIDGTYGWGGYGWKSPRNISDMRAPNTFSENIAKLAQYTTFPKIQPTHGGYSPDTKMHNPENRYEMYPESKFQIGKDFRMKYTPEMESPDKHHYSPAVEMKLRYGMDPEEMHRQKIMQSNMRSQHPDITRDLDIA